MEYRYLGKTGLQVSALSFGTWITFGNQIEDELAEKLMLRAYEKGVNFFDNAEIYANGRSEEVMGKILNKVQWDRSSYLVSSKVFFGSGGKKPNQTGLNRKHVFEACHAALKRLRVEYLDLYFCHRPDKNTPMEETVWAMNHLIQQGKVLYWGTSEWSALEIMEAHKVAAQLNLIGPVVEQPQYNLLHREKVESEYLKLYDTVGLGTTIWSPLASGTLTDKYLQEFPKDTRLTLNDLKWLKEKSITEGKLRIIQQLNHFSVRELGIPLSQLALAWTLRNSKVSTTILGASKLAHLDQNLEALSNVKLIDSGVEKRIEEILNNQPVLPDF
jgi:voltage-dependent potassium channel beta subunit